MRCVGTIPFSCPHVVARVSFAFSLCMSLVSVAEGEAEGVRWRLRGVVGRLAATEEEVAGVLGEGAL